MNKNNHTYGICCQTVSNPLVNYTLYDTDTMMPFTNIYNNNTYLWTLGSTSQLTVSLQLTDNRLDNIRSITCAATSSNPRVPFNETTISRNVTVEIPLSSCKYNYFRIFSINYFIF